MNAYWMVQDIRDSLDEGSASHWADVDILTKLNRAYRQAVMKMLLADKSYFLKKSDALTPSSAQLTLPSDCAKPVYLETATNKYPVGFNFELSNRQAGRVVGSDLETGDLDAYLLESVIELNTDTFTDDCYLWYVRRIPDLHCGTSDAGAATSITLMAANRPSRVDDYYNNVGIELVGGTLSLAVDTITDYTGKTGVAVVTGTYGADTIYGTTSELPQEADDFVIAKATMLCMAKPSAALDPKYFEYYAAIYKEARKDFLDWIDTRVSDTDRVTITDIE